MFTLPYCRFPVDPNPAFPSGDEIPRASGWAGISHGDQSSKVFQVIVDTGCDYCVFPIDVLDQLGIEMASLPHGRIKGMGEDLPIYYARVTLWVSGIGQWDVYAGFSEFLRGLDGGFLGFRGFLERFQATFDPQAETLTLIPILIDNDRPTN